MSGGDSTGTLSSGPVRMFLSERHVSKSRSGWKYIGAINHLPGRMVLREDGMNLAIESHIIRLESLESTLFIFFVAFAYSQLTSINQLGSHTSS